MRKEEPGLPREGRSPKSREALPGDSALDEGGVVYGPSTPLPDPRKRQGDRDKGRRAG